jgi:diacylglycerol diphosphate phosphatase/phosphatidate phosphatase
MMVGRPRPDLIDRCQPPAGATDHALYGLSTVDICTNTNRAQLDDGFKVSYGSCDYRGQS